MSFLVYKYGTRRYRLWAKLLNIAGCIRISPYPMFFSYVKLDDNAKYGDIYHEIKKSIQPGDILIRRINNKLNNFLFPTFYTHTAMYIGDSEKYGKERIVHAVTPKVQLTDLISYLNTASVIAIIRPNINPEKKNKAVSNAINLLGNKFDYNFEFNSPDKSKRRYYCSELVFMSYKDYLEELGWHTAPQRVLGFNKIGFSPDDFLPSEHSKTEVIFQSKIRD